MVKGATSPLVAFHAFWFGAKSLPRVQVLLQSFRVRFDAFPDALAALHAWSMRDPESLADAARFVCHWHTQLTDPLYRAFTRFLVERRDSPNPTVTRDVALAWVDGYPGASAWTTSTRIQFASKLLSAAFAAGLVASNSERAARPLAAPRVPDRALAYLLHLLRPLAAAHALTGTLTDNPYLASLGLAGAVLEARLRALPELEFRRQGSLIDVGFRHADLAAWAAATFPEAIPPARAGARA